MGSRINRNRTQKTKEEVKKHPLVELFNKYANIITIGLGVVLLIVIAMVIFRTINSKKEMEATTIYDQAIMNLQQQNEPNKQYQALSELIQTYSDTMAANRSRLVIGQLYYFQYSQSRDRKDLEKARDMYLEVLSSARQDFYQAVAHISVAQVYEELNEYNMAFTEYEIVVNDYKDAGFTPLAMIGMARSKEMIPNGQASAKLLYQQVAEQYPDSQWAQYARGKVYFYNEAVLQQQNTPGSTIPGLPQNNLNLQPIQ